MILFLSGSEAPQQMFSVDAACGGLSISMLLGQSHVRDEITPAIQSDPLEILGLNPVQLTSLPALLASDLVFKRWFEDNAKTTKYGLVVTLSLSKSEWKAGPSALHAHDSTVDMIFREYIEVHSY